jgi:hypothetical protein
MIATPIPQCSPSSQRPAFRVVCAWCEQPIEGTTPDASTLTGTSHGICPPCARRHFGLDLESLAEGQRCA